MSLSGIRDGLYKALEDIRGLHVHKYAPDAFPQLPAVIFTPRQTIYDIDFGGNQEHTWEVTIFVNQGQGLERAQEELDDFLATSGSKSIKAALEEDRTLGGQCDSLAVRGFTDYGGLAFKSAEPEYIGARIEVNILE